MKSEKELNFLLLKKNWEAFLKQVTVDPAEDIIKRYEKVKKILSQRENKWTLLK